MVHRLDCPKDIFTHSTLLSYSIFDIIRNMLERYIPQSHQLPALKEDAPHDVTKEFNMIPSLSEGLFPKYKPDPILQFMLLVGLSPYHKYSGDKRRISYGQTPQVVVSPKSDILEHFVFTEGIKTICVGLLGSLKIQPSKIKS